MNQDSNQQTELSRPFNEEEISLLDIVAFLQGAWKIVAISGFLGIVASVTYILAVPNQYEATAQIRMAQISQLNPANPLGAPIEDPASLISRMQFPTNYPTQVISACGYEGKPQAGLELSKDLKLSILKGVANTVELRVLSPSPELAIDCANAVFSQIEVMQGQMSKPFVEEAKTKLASDNERIDAAKRLIAKADHSGDAMSAAYLSARDELTYFLTDREKMVDLINSVKNRGTSLVSPIYAASRPVSPKKTISLIVGVFGGIFIGLLIALSRQLMAKLKPVVQGVVL